MADDSSAPVGFPTTRWSCLRIVQDRRHPEYRPTVNRFVQMYWRPVFYFLRVRGMPWHEAQDVTQEFFIFWLEREMTARFDPQRGRFRSFLLKLLQNFVADRGPERGPRQEHFERSAVAIESLLHDEDRTYEPPANARPEDVFHREWARTLWGRVLDNLREQCAGEGREFWFEIFVAYHMGEGKRPSQEDLGRPHGLSRDAVAKILDKMEKRFSRLLRNEVREQAGCADAEIDAEIGELNKLLNY